MTTPGGLFDPGWVAALLDATDQLTRVALLPGKLPGHARVLAWVTEMFGRFSSAEVPRVRAWVGGAQRYSIAEDLMQLARGPALSLPDRLAAATRSDSYCVTFNGLTAWSPSFDDEMRRSMLEPLYRGLGQPPRAGCDYYLFVGNYGFTPFGVHADADQSLLWHLGPGDKTAYIWPRAEFQALTGDILSTQEYLDLLPHAHRFVLTPGDLLFIPMGDFHIFETPDLSAMLGLTLFPDAPALECAEGLRLLAPDAAALQSVVDEPLRLDELCWLHRCALASNGHVITPPNLTRPDHATPLDVDGCMISAIPQCPMQTIEIAGREGLLVRGRVLWSRQRGLYQALRDALLHARRLPFRQLAAQFAGRIQLDAMYGLIGRLHEMGGVVLERG